MHLIEECAAKTSAKGEKIMADPTGDRNDPELRFLSVERTQFNDPTTQAEWTQKRLVWVPHENQVRSHLH